MHTLIAQLRILRRFLLAFVVGLLTWTATADFALAKVRKSEPAPPPQEKDYLMPYALVVLGIALGVIVVSRPSHRANEPKMPIESQQDEKK